MNDTIRTVDATPASIYAEPRVVVDRGQCAFYHTMDIPGYGLVRAQWDLRGREREYLGNVDFAGKRVLEVGTASGFLCFWMERQGAEMVAYDLSDDYDWDVIPFAQYDHASFRRERRKALRGLNDGWWFVHRAVGSRARVVYGTVYEIPPAIGPVDISTYGSILLHLRDPFQSLYKASVLTRERMIVTDLLPPMGRGKALYFKPDFRTVEPRETWWWLSPDVIVEMLGVLGFEDSTVTFHHQKHELGEVELFTVVGRRTREFRPPEGSPAPG
jgi:hypothetical protein